MHDAEKIHLQIGIRLQDLIGFRRRIRIHAVPAFLRLHLENRSDAGLPLSLTSNKRDLHPRIAQISERLV